MLKLRPYQQSAIAAIYSYFEDKNGNPLVVIPTAGGKSLVMASFIDGVLKAWPDQRILVVTHVRELIAQNHAEMLGLWPQAPAGIYSAGLGRRDADARILFAGIQSIHRRPAEIGHCDLILIDEAHLIPGKASTMYRKFLDAMKRINPKLKVIGLTATPYRLDSGMLHEGENALFSDIAYEVSVRDLIMAGYLSPLMSKQPQTKFDVTGVSSRGGEFIARDLEKAVDQDAITRAAVGEIIAYGKDRKSWLAFCSGVSHATHVAEEFRRRGISCATIFGDTPKDERDRIIAEFKAGKIRALASMSAAGFLKRVAQVLEDRGTAYGDPKTQMEAIARRWSITLGTPVTAQQVALCMIDLKLARLAHDPSYADGPVDVIGYAALIPEIIRGSRS